MLNIQTIPPSEHLLSKIMSTRKANLFALAVMAFFFVGIVIADVTQGNSEDLFLGRTDGHNHAAYGANTHSNSGVMNKGENSGADSNERKLMVSTTDGQTDGTMSPRHRSPDWYCQYIGKTEHCP
ncbi:uncharacterized protein LOC127771786 [Oryza glaberrima]|nr:uncharacterized protein LOC127771786 [Oryza glaberrima]